MADFQCSNSWCRRSFYLKDGHFCFLRGKPDNTFSESFIDKLDKIADELETAIGNENCASDDIGNSNPKIQSLDSPLNTSFERDENFLSNSFSPETEVSSSLATPFSTQSLRMSPVQHPMPRTQFGASTSDSPVGVRQNIAKASEGGPVSSFLFPQGESRGEIFRTDDNQSNPSEHFYSEKNFESGECREVSQKILKNTCKMKGIKKSEFSRGRNLSHLDSKTAPLKSRRGHKSKAKNSKSPRKVKSVSAVVAQTDGSSGIEIATNSASLGCGAEAESVSLPWPSGMRRQSPNTGKGIRFLCDLCGKDFTQKQGLDRHKRIHTGEKPFVCLECGKKFTQQGILMKHLRTHTGEKPFVCEFCQKAFTEKALLQEHLRIHTGEKPFSCELCGKKFAHSSTLRFHRLTHTGEKPHACHLCSKAFIRISSLKAHIRTHKGK